VIASEWRWLPGSHDEEIEMTMRAETILSELNRLRKDLVEDPSDIEYLALHHAFCFISYKMTEFQKYVEEQDARGAFDQYQS